LVQWQGYGLDNLEFESWQEQGILLICKMSRRALGPTQHLIQWVTGFFSWGKAAGARSKPLTST